MKLAEVAQKLGCRLEGSPEVEIRGVAGIERAEAGQITFLANRRYFPLLKTTRASAVLVEEGISLDREASLPALAALRSGNPYLAFAQAIELFYQPPRYSPGIHPTAIIAKSASIGEGAHVGPCCYVDEDVEIGRNAKLHSFVTIYRGAKIGDDFFAHAHAVVREFCRIGNRVILQNGVVIGGDGFETRIGRGTKLDDLVLIGHASQVGTNTMLCGQVGLAGSTKIGSNSILAGQVGTAGHLTVGDGTVITAQSGVPNDVPAHSLYSGYPAVENREWLKTMAALNRLPELQKRVRELETKVEQLEGR